MCLYLLENNLLEFLYFVSEIIWFCAQLIGLELQLRNGAFLLAGEKLPLPLRCKHRVKLVLQGGDVHLLHRGYKEERKEQSSYVVSGRLA